MDADLRALRERLAEISDLSKAVGVLGWDQKVVDAAGRPPRSCRGDGHGRTNRAREVRRRRDRPPPRPAAPLEESLDYDSDDASLIRVTRRDWEKQRRVPTELRTEMIRAAALGNQVWIEARATNDFAKFLPALERNLELKRRYVECFEWEDSPYTPLLDDFEPHMLTSEVAEVFGTIRPVLAELVREAPHVDALVPAPALPARTRAGLLRPHPRRRSASKTARTASTRRSTRSARRSPDGTYA